MSKNKNKNRGGYSTPANKTPGAGGAKVIAFILLVAIVAYFVTALAFGIKAGAPVWKPWEWGKAGKTQTQPGGDDADNNNPVIAVGSDGEAIRAGSAYSLRRSADNGITYLSETRDNQTYVPDGEIIVSAELSNEYVNGAFDWSVDFVNPAAEWAVSKVAAYYVSVTPIAGDSSRATLRYLAPFGEQLRLTATLRGSDSSDSCTIDCVKPVTSYKIEYGNNDFDDWSEFSNYSIVYGTGTITGTFEFVSGRIEIKDSFIDDFKSYLKFDVNIKVANYTSIDVTDTTAYSDTYIIKCGDIMYSMFIKDFDNYDTAHKEAIYYAWYTAYKPYWGTANVNALLDCDFNYVYNGVKISGHYCSDEPTVRLIGSNYGADVAPNTTLNKNYVF